MADDRTAELIRLALEPPPLTADQLGVIMRQIRHGIAVIGDLKALADGRSID